MITKIENKKDKYMIVQDLNKKLQKIEEDVRKLSVLDLIDQIDKQRKESIF